MKKYRSKDEGSQQPKRSRDFSASELMFSKEFLEPRTFE